ncbi:alpha/beta-hydrolase [Lentinus brumalis]|uniref:Alpha/beta-hydrolase n=1 Tax=Lentinus brumalis TaxID=2498619 RepID=A0A371DTS9_9APHY|nr:alpha/beta-hydrolase [Polyporus brumalis]
MSSNFPVRVDHSMEALPSDAPIRQVYPADLCPGGSYAPLPHGRVRYWILGPEDGTKVVLIHGVSTPSVSWKAIGPYLAQNGFQVLIYDLYGKGYSEAPHVPSDATLFVTQLALLMQYVRWDAAHIVGFSMGGGVAAAFTASLPHLVAGKTILIASAGLMETTPLSPTAVSSKVALLQYQELRQLQSSELPGYKRSLASCFTDGPIRGLQSTFDKLANLSVGPASKPLEVLIIHGTDDGIVPYEEANKIKARVPQAEVITVEGAGHDLVLRDEHWKIVADAIVHFLED